MSIEIILEKEAAVNGVSEKAEKDSGVADHYDAVTAHGIVVANALELFADDCSIFLSPKSENLRNAMNILTDFYHLSGLKILVTKTKAIWFGKDADSDLKLCKEENLVWSRTFSLLGLDFDNKLENMKKNYSEKINDIDFSKTDSGKVSKVCLFLLEPYFSI